MSRVNDHDAELAGGRARPALAGAATARAKRLVVPVALTVVTLGAVASLGGALAGLAGAGCTDSAPHADASPFDAAPDTPIV